VLGQTVIDNLFGSDDPIGATIRVQGLPCKVTGVLQAKGFSAMGQDQDDFVLLPFTTVQKRITGTFWLDDIFCSAVSRDAMSEATRQITGLLRERHHMNPGEDDDFNVRRPEDLIQAHLPELFPGVEVLSASSFRVTRDADIEIREEEANDLLRSVAENVSRRRFGAAVRLELRSDCGEEVRSLLRTQLELDDDDVYEFEGPLGGSDLLAIPRLATSARAADPAVTRERPATDAPDPSAAIDWLLRGAGGTSRRDIERP
jgi:hypothetical protein